jgi:hypothetical protein
MARFSPLPKVDRLNGGGRARVAASGQSAGLSARETGRARRGRLAAAWARWMLTARRRDKLLKRARKQGMTSRGEVIELVEAWKRAATRIDRKHRRHKRH